MKFSEIELPSNRKFGFFFTAIFALAGAYFLYQNAVTLSYVLFILATLFLLATVIKSELLLPLNKLWMRFGLLIGMIVSPIVLGVMFFGLFTPMALFMRLIGRDELRLKLKPRQSYWKPRETGDASADAFKHQF